MKADVLFPTIVWSEQLEDVDNLAIKEYALNLQSNSAGRQVSNCGGWQSQSFTNLDPVLDLLRNKIEVKVLEASMSVGIPSPFFANMWININPAKAHNNIHNHRGAIISGVYYVDVPEENMGNIEFYRNDEADYYLDKVQGKRNNFTSLTVTYPAITGMLYLFPSWLKHSVQSNNGTQNRISISFNYELVK